MVPHRPRGLPGRDPLRAFARSRGRFTVLPAPAGFVHTSALRIHDRTEVRGNVNVWLWARLESWELLKDDPVPGGGR